MYYLRCKWLGVDVTYNVTRMGVLYVFDFLTRKQTIDPMLTSTVSRNSSMMQQHVL